MCGIAGVFNFDSDNKIDVHRLKKMTDVIAYRGPDGEGHYVKNNIGLGHRRLSIIDLTTGNQPMYSNDKSVVLAYNGEIYNYIELKEELIHLGYQFRTSSDTEVIIKAYEHWGIDCQNRFNGMWAFALWDDKSKQLMLSVDRMSEKPLHYTFSERGIIFGSEMKSLFAYGVPKELNMEFVELYLSLGFVPAPLSFFKNVQKLKPGSCLIVHDRKVKEVQYWDLPEIDENEMLTNEKDIYENFEYLFEDSVKIRMRSDVPFGAFLSGGLDSSCIVALMSKISSFPVETFTMGFEEKNYDERDLAKEVAAHFSTNHHEKVVLPNTFEESLKQVAHQYDEPFGDSSAIPTGYVSKFAASKVKMVLTGDGGDEVLSGYTLYRHEKFAVHYQKLPNWIKKSIPSIIAAVPNLNKESLSYKLSQAELIAGSFNKDFNGRYLHKDLCGNLDTIKELTKNLSVYPIEDFMNDFMKNCHFKDPFYKLMYLNFKLTLPNDMLVKVDRMSMAHSLETRAPFLDHRLIEYMAKVDKKVKMNGLQNKSVLRNTIGQQLPSSLLKAPKKGFSVPLKKWFHQESFEPKFKDLGNHLSFIDSAVLKELIEKNNLFGGQIKTGNLIWMLFVLGKIYKD